MPDTAASAAAAAAWEAMAPDASPVIDGLGPEGVAAATRYFGQRASRLQSGYVFHYAFAMVIGVVVLVTWFYLYG